MTTIQMVRIGLLGALLLFGGCGGPGEVPRGSEGGTGPERSAAPSGEAAFPGSLPSLDAVGEHVLRALDTGDTVALEQVRLSEQEHNSVVWPELPAARPEVNFPVELAWENIQLRNRKELDRILPWFRGREVAFGGVLCADLQSFHTFRVHTDCRVRFRVGGRWLEAGLFKDVVERGGGFKIFRYYADPPRAPLARSTAEPVSSHAADHWDRVTESQDRSLEYEHW